MWCIATKLSTPLSSTTVLLSTCHTPWRPSAITCCDITRPSPPSVLRVASCAVSALIPRVTVGCSRCAVPASRQCDELYADLPIELVHVLLCRFTINGAITVTLHNADTSLSQDSEVSAMRSCAMHCPTVGARLHLHLHRTTPATTNDSSGGHGVAAGTLCQRAGGPVH